MRKATFLELARAALFVLMAAAGGRAEAGTTSTTVFPTLSIFETFAAAPFDPIDPSAQELEVHITGTWTFSFAHDPAAAPYTGSLYFGPSDLEFYIYGPHADDGDWGFDTQVGNVKSFENFTGQVTYTVHVDSVTDISADSMRNFTGPGNGTLFLEGQVADWMQLNDGDPRSIYLAGGSVQGLTVQMTAVPEPLSTSLMIAGIAVMGLGLRRRAARGITG
jgi:hypothetical protein